MAANTSSKVASITGAAKDDLFSSLVTNLSEDSRTASLNVLANDPGAAKLYSLKQEAQAVSTSTPFQVVTTALSKLGATISISADGKVKYDASNLSLESLNEGQLISDSFVYTVRMANGALSTASATVDLIGKNDAPVILSAASDISGAVKEDMTSTASGNLVATDADSISTQSWTISGNPTGQYGALEINSATGEWVYKFDNAAHQYLVAGETHRENFTVRVTDDRGAFAEQLVVIDVVGTNDIASISGTATGSVTEDAAQNTVAGTLLVTDVDTGEAGFQVQNGTVGAHGALTLLADGNWTYALNNISASVQSLAAGEQAVDTFVVKSLDGTESAIDVTITGANDVAAITGTNVAALLEDGAPAAGNLAVSDVDHDESVFQTQANTAGTYGSFGINTSGAWSYNLNNAAQALTAGQIVTDTFSVTSKDGSATETVTLTVTGENDIASISGATTRSVTEDATQNTVVGSLAVTDVDAGEAEFVGQLNEAGLYGAFSIDKTGQWNYVLDNSKAEVQALAANQQVTETFTVKSKDGTASQAVTVSVLGTNDAAIISGDNTGQVTEDASSTVVTGTLSINDADAGEASFQALNSVVGTYGSFSIGTAGNWSYTLNNSASNVQALNTADHKSDSFTVLSQDGTSKQVTIAVNGVDDGHAPVAANDFIAGSNVITFNYGTNIGPLVRTFSGNTTTYSYSAGDYILKSTVTSGYGSLNWYPDGYGVNGSGMMYSYSYYSSAAPSIELTRADGLAFSFESANITSYMTGGSTAKITGYKNGVLVGTETDSTVPVSNYRGYSNLNKITVTDPDFANVDKVVFTLTNTSGNSYYGYNYEFIDDLTMAGTVSQVRDVNVLANDSDVDPNTHLSVGTFSAFSTHGAKITLNANGTLHYDPTVSSQLQAVAQGTDVYDTFTYQAQDDQGNLSNVAIVGIHVTGVAHI